MFGRGEVFRDASGRPIRAAGTGQDISEKKRMERELQQSEERFRNLCLQAPVMLMSFDPEGRVRDDTSCPLVQVVLDTRNGRLWTSLGMAMREVQGVTVRSEKGRTPQRSEGRHSLRWHEGEDWIAKRLSNLNAGGEDRTKLPAGGGQVEVRMRWRFEPARRGTDKVAMWVQLPVEFRLR